MPFSKAMKRLGGSVRSALGVMDKATEEKIPIAEELAFQATEQADYYQRNGDINALRKAISLSQGAINVLNEDHSPQPFARNDFLSEFLHDLFLAECHQTRDLFFATNDSKVLDELIEKLRPIYDLAPKPSRCNLFEACFLSRTYIYRYFAYGEKNDDDYQAALELANAALSNLKKWKSKLTLLPQDLETINDIRQIVEMPIGVTKGLFLYNRASSLKRQFGLRRDLTDLESARSSFAQALKLFPPSNEYHTKAAVEVADCVVNQVNRTSDVKNLSSALQSINTINFESLNPESFVDAAITKTLLFRAKFDHYSDPKDLEMAIETAKKAAQPKIKNINNRITALQTLSNQLCRRAELRLSVDDMDASIAAARQGLEVCPAKWPQRSGAYTVLGSRLGIKYSIFGNVEDLTESITLLREAVSALPKENSMRAMRLHNLANGLRDVYSSTGNSDALEECIALEREALRIVSDDDSSKYVMLDSLSLFLNLRYKITQSSEDLNEAISAAEDALQGTPRGHIRYPKRLHSLASVLVDKFSRTKEIQVVDRAIQLASDAISSSTYDEESQVHYLFTLSACLSSKYRISKDLQDLDKAIKISREVLERGPASHPSRYRWKRDLGTQLQKRFDATDSMEERRKYLAEALNLQEECIKEIPAADPDMAWTLCTKGFLTLKLNEVLQDDAKEQHDSNLLAAITSFRQGFDHPAALPMSQVRNGLLAGSSYISLKQWDHAGDILSRSIRVFNKISPLSLDENDRQYQLSGLSNMSMYACLAFIMQNKPDEAVEILEAGRGVMANIAMRQHDRVPILKEKNPDLHGRYTELRNSLSQSVPSQRSRTVDLIKQRRMDQERFEQLEEEIRQLPGLENFNRTMSAKQIQALAIQGPLVSFCVSSGYQSSALIVTSDAIQSLPLPELLYADVEKKVPLITGDNRLSLRPPSKRPVANKQMRALLAWLWEVAVEPVLKHLDLLQSQEKSELPRIWWITSSYLGLMPLHAAGKGSKHPKANTYDHVISSYSSTFSALAFARECQSRVSESAPNVALVTMPHTAARSSLNTEGEAEAVRTAFSSTDSDRAESVLVELCQPPAAEVLKQVRGGNIDIFHFSCHAEPDLSDPSNTAFLFGDDASAESPDPMPIQHLRKFNSNADLSLRAPQLAYLSACCTAQQYDLKLLAENVHLAAILQLIGFPAVIGTLWEADDKAAAFIAKAFYEELTRMNHAYKSNEEKRSKEDQVARALHVAVTACRNAKFGRAKGSEDVLLWANFVHYGA
ncbi:hypothetical protein BU24DRAFT_497306 [Aaosphaeria arxii CBS 175.79]|uniref:CHAT domain-containing protein n=1 Tax=Aaosphaeria arxii CBS 175.79 TaxID=1450172 RepID=A0A6A5X9L9_9PLEO|nr:uncharacterized protein BU24DRAFT_497306 [Aaosphaeria arxii CBS 175.79]KAF2009745.1 hypothetical protein BU24DRAFT_497306 [Aaosphaeria arxii CBS 175.79]